QAATGTHVCFMDHDDAIEPQALYRFAETVLADDPDLIYTDELIADEDIDQIKHVVCRPAFSYDHYLSHPYFVHMVAVRRDLPGTGGGYDESLTISADVDFVLRVLERARAVAHIPDPIYRWRLHGTSTGHQKQDKVMESTLAIIRGHHRRLGSAARVEAGP